MWPILFRILEKNIDFHTVFCSVEKAITSYCKCVFDCIFYDECCLYVAGPYADVHSESNPGDRCVRDDVYSGTCWVTMQ